MKIVLLFSAFVLIVNGRTLEKGQNKRELILKALSTIRKKDTWFPQQIMERPDFNPPQYGLNKKLEQIKQVLEMLKENLDYFKEKHGNGDGEGDLQNEIDNLYDEIQNLKATLKNAMTNKNYLLILSWKLYEIHGDNFFDAFIEAVDQGVFDEDEPLPTAEYGTTGDDYGVLSPKEQLSEIAEIVKEIRRIVKVIVVDGNKSYQLVQAILAGLDNVQTYTTPGYETTTSNWWFWPTTTEEPTGNSGTTSGESTGNTGTTMEPTSTTENMFVRKKNFLRRQLIDLLQQKLQKKTDARREKYPPY